MIQNVIVFLIVACAVWTAAGRYMPSALRHLAWQQISDAARRFGWLRVAAHADKKREASPACGSGCKQCDGCGRSAPASATVQFITLPRSIKGNAAK